MTCMLSTSSGSPAELTCPVPCLSFGQCCMLFSFVMVKWTLAQ